MLKLLEGRMGRIKCRKCKKRWIDVKNINGICLSCRPEDFNKKRAKEYAKKWIHIKIGGQDGKE